MSTPPLQHTYPQWEPPENDPWAPTEDWCQVQRGCLRIVRNRKRARLLQRRGVPVWRCLGTWLWFVERT